MFSPNLTVDWYRPQVTTNAHGHESITGYTLHRADIVVQILGLEARSHVQPDATHEREDHIVMVMFPSRYGVPQRNDELRNLRSLARSFPVSVRLTKTSVKPGMTGYYVCEGVVTRASD
jgi:hypothetical protein